MFHPEDRDLLEGLVWVVLISIVVAFYVAVLSPEPAERSAPAASSFEPSGR